MYKVIVSDCQIPAQENADKKEAGFKEVFQGIRDAYPNGVVVTFRNAHTGHESDAFLFANEFYPVTPLDIEGVTNAEIRDICRIAKLDNSRQLNELFWGNDIALLTTELWSGETENETELKRKLINEILDAVFSDISLL